MVKDFYEKPNLKKYGTMKDLTLTKGGSLGTVGGIKNPQPDPDDAGLTDILFAPDGSDTIPFVSGGDFSRPLVDDNDDFFKD